MRKQPQMLHTSFSRNPTVTFFLRGNDEEQTGSEIKPALMSSADLSLGARRNEGDLGSDAAALVGFSQIFEAVDGKSLMRSRGREARNRSSRSTSATAESTRGGSQIDHYVVNA
jgi:hypothetical protein